MKKLICLILSLAVVISANTFTLAAERSYTMRELKSMVKTCKQNKDTAHEMAECARKLGYPEECEAIKIAQVRWKQENDAQKEYQSLLDEKKAQYPYAYQVWDIMESKGYYDYVIAGILGSMMRETGGDTLSLNPLLYGGGGSYYGLCQWSLYYYPGAKGLDLAGQMNFLLGNIKEKMDGFGGAGTYDRFCKLQDEREAARYFNSYY